MDLKVLWTISNSLGTVSDINMLKNARGFNIDVVTADRVDGDCPGFVVTGKKYVVPGGREPGYIDSILKICQKEGITTIIPQYGDELVTLSQNASCFKDKNIKVLVTEDWEKLSIANNKKKLYDFFKGEGFIPKYSWSSDINSIEESAYELGYPDTPVCIKLAEGEGGKGFRIITEEKVDIFNDKSALVKVNLNIMKKQLEGLTALPELLAIEYLPGREYSVDCICKDGETFVCIPRQRVDTALGVAVVSVVEKNQELIGISKEIIKALNLSYNVNLQFKYSHDGSPKLIEVNPRVSGSLVANYGAGVNMLELALKLAYGLPLENINVKWGTKMVRYWNEIFIKA